MNNGYGIGQIYMPGVGYLQPGGGITAKPYSTIPIATPPSRGGDYYTPPEEKKPVIGPADILPIITPVMQIPTTGTGNSSIYLPSVGYLLPGGGVVQDIKNFQQNALSALPAGTTKTKEGYYLLPDGRIVSAVYSGDVITSFKLIGQNNIISDNTEIQKNITQSVSSSPTQYITPTTQIKLSDGTVLNPVTSTAQKQTITEKVTGFFTNLFNIGKNTVKSVINPVATVSNVATATIGVISKPAELIKNSGNVLNIVEAVTGKDTLSALKPVVSESGLIIGKTVITGLAKNLVKQKPITVNQNVNVTQTVKVVK